MSKPFHTVVATLHYLQSWMVTRNSKSQNVCGCSPLHRLRVLSISLFLREWLLY